jgi:hypothetical protein
MADTDARRSLTMAAAAGAALILAACSSSGTTTTASSAPPITPASPAQATPSVSPPTATPTTKPASTGPKLPKPPAGSKERSKHQISSGTYARYSNATLSAPRVVKKYKKKATKAGYTIKSSGAHGGGWGGYGGSEAGMTAVKSGAYMGVQAGGSRQGATYFEVCVGADKGAVDECDHRSGRDSNHDSNSGGS